jgi:hypothetical protein
MYPHDRRDNADQMSSLELARWLERRVASHTPTAVVRFGDGEARLLKADAANASSMRLANDQLQGETGRKFSQEEILDIRGALEHARDQADVLGTLPLTALQAERVAAGKPAAVLASSLLHHEILAELPRLVSGRQVSVISCRDVKPVIEDGWGLDDVAVYQIPSQYRTRDVDGAYEAALYDVSIWPDAHDRVRSELTVRERGEVFLVAAGLFGKDLCIDIRSQGGIALDMGSTLDHIAGKLTRNPMRRMFELHAEGVPVPEIAEFLQERFGARVDHDRIREFVTSVSPYLR